MARPRIKTKVVIPAVKEFTTETPHWSDSLIQVKENRTKSEIALEAVNSLFG